MDKTHAGQALAPGNQPVGAQSVRNVARQKSGEARVLDVYVQTTTLGQVGSDYHFLWSAGSLRSGHSGPWRMLGRTSPIPVIYAVPQNTRSQRANTHLSADSHMFKGTEPCFGSQLLKIGNVAV